MQFRHHLIHYISLLWPLELSSLTATQIRQRHPRGLPHPPRPPTTLEPLPTCHCTARAQIPGLLGRTLKSDQGWGIPFQGIWQVPKLGVPFYTPNYYINLIIGAPRSGPLIFGNSHIGEEQVCRDHVENPTFGSDSQGRSRSPWSSVSLAPTVAIIIGVVTVVLTVVIVV